MTRRAYIGLLALATLAVALTAAACTASPAASVSEAPPSLTQQPSLAPTETLAVQTSTSDGLDALVETAAATPTPDAVTAEYIAISESVTSTPKICET